MPRVRGPVPEAMVVHLKYVKAGVQSSISAAIGQYINYKWNTNSIFDPDASGAGHQPRFHDQWATMYRKYYVRKFTIRARMHNTNLVNDAGGYLFLEHRSVNDLSKIAVTSSIERNIERANSANNVKLKRFLSPGSGGQTHWVTKSLTLVPAFDLEGRDKHTNTAAFGTNPSTLTELLVSWVFPQAGGTKSVFLEYDIDYEVCLMDPIMPSQS